MDDPIRNISTTRSKRVLYVFLGLLILLLIASAIGRVLWQMNKAEADFFINSIAWQIICRVNESPDFRGTITDYEWSERMKEQLGAIQDKYIITMAEGPNAKFLLFDDRFSEIAKRDQSSHSFILFKWTSDAIYRYEGNSVRVFSYVSIEKELTR